MTNDDLTLAEAEELAQSIIDDADEVPEEGEDFAASVSDIASGILDWMQEHGRVTSNQLRALQNMREGLDKWLDGPMTKDERCTLASS